MHRFESNWYTTVDSIREFDDAAFEKLKLPGRLIDKIKEKLRVSSLKDTKKPSKTITTKKSDKNVITSMEIEPSKNKKQENKIIEEKINGSRSILEQLKKETISRDVYVNALDLLDKITTNIIKEPSNEKFRILNLNNVKLRSALFQFNSVVDLLSKVSNFSNSLIKF